MIKLIIFDADKTLWDHHNISEFEGEIKKISENEIIDSKGNRLKLADGVREVLSKLKSLGIIIAMATWNFEDKTLKVLEVLGLIHYFDIIVSKPYPYKFIMIREILQELLNKNIKVKPNEILFVDDRRQHFGYVWLYIGNIKCIEMWKDVNSLFEILKIINEYK
jgi:magnesium-dependent phosphatase-1